VPCDVEIMARDIISVLHIVSVYTLNCTCVLQEARTETCPINENLADAKMVDNVLPRITERYVGR